MALALTILPPPSHTIIPVRSWSILEIGRKGKRDMTRILLLWLLITPVAFLLSIAVAVVAASWY
jgi:hypothetical protein